MTDTSSEPAVHPRRIVVRSHIAQLAHRDGDPAAAAAALILARLLNGDPATLGEAVTAAADTDPRPDVARWLWRCSDELELPAARAFNDTVNAHLVDESHRR